MSSPGLPNHQWVVVRFKTPLIFTRDRGEAWAFNAGVRYILNANLLTDLGEHTEEISTLAGLPDFKPLKFPMDISHARILVERYRGRGIGDLLFTTGPLAWLQAISGHSAKIYTYAMASRLPILAGNTALAADPGVGPIQYGSLRDYDFHWLIDTVTEYVSGREQVNVYDALFRQLGVDPATVADTFKRPRLELGKADQANFDHFAAGLRRVSRVDLAAGFTMVAPLCQSQLRAAPYSLWLDIISALAVAAPVLVVGSLDEPLPDPDMGVGEFSTRLDAMAAENPRIVNAIGPMPLRTMATAASRARLVVSLDSGPLYAAQAARTPAVSLWGATAPAARIGHDAAYMALAVQRREACRHAPCHAWGSFPAGLCPSVEPRVCAPLAAITLDQVMEKVEAATARFSEAR